MAADTLRYEYAIIRGIPESFASGSLRLDEPESAIDRDRALQQHALYEQALRKLDLKVIVLPADETYPDCVFIEDTAVIVGKTVLLTNPGHPSRRGEVAAVRSAFEELGGFCIQQMTGDALLDGGDVLYTGHHFFVGQSSRTNSKGLLFLKQVFKDIAVHPIEVTGHLHLKSVCSLCDNRTIAIADTPFGHSVASRIHDVDNAYKFLFFTEPIGANCLLINDSIVHRSDYAESTRIYQALKKPMIGLCMSENEKSDGALTCCSLLF